MPWRSPTETLLLRLFSYILTVPNSTAHSQELVLGSGAGGCWAVLTSSIPVSPAWGPAWAQPWCCGWSEPPEPVSNRRQPHAVPMSSMVVAWCPAQPCWKFYPHQIPSDFIQEYDGMPNISSGSAGGQCSTPEMPPTPLPLSFNVRHHSLLGGLFVEYLNGSQMKLWPTFS